MYRVKEFSFHPLPHTIEIDIEEDTEKDITESKKTKSKSTPVRHSVWNCDGELIRDPRIHLRYSETCHNLPLKRPKIGFQDRLSLNAGQKNCRMLKESILQYLTFIKLPFVFKTFVLYIFEWPLYNRKLRNIMGLCYITLLGPIEFSIKLDAVMS